MQTLRQRWLDQLIAWCHVNQKEHAWRTAKELDKSGLFEGMARDLEANMKQLTKDKT